MWKKNFKILLQTSASVQNKAPNQPITRSFNWERREFRSGVWGGAPAEIEICTISTAKSGLLVTSFSSNHENMWSRNPAAYTAHFQITTEYYM